MYIYIYTGHVGARTGTCEAPCLRKAYCRGKNASGNARQFDLQSASHSHDNQAVSRVYSAKNLRYPCILSPRRYVSVSFMGGSPS